MADQKLKVVFKRVYVLDDSDWIGSGEFYFKVTVAGVAVGDPKRTFDAVEKTWINLPEAQWSTVVNVTGKDKVEVRFQGMDADLISDDDLGTVGFNLKPPWTQRVFRQATNFYIIEWQVELEVAGKFGMHPPDTVFACRENNGSVDCTTVSGTGITARLEIHPVRPVPTVGLPPRAPFPAGTGPPEQNLEGTIVLPDDPLNVVTNPSVIPLLSEPDPAPPAAPPARAAGAPPPATITNAAQIEYSYYQPDVLAFADNDRRLEWTARTAPGATGGAVAFIDPRTGAKISGPAHGLKIMTYGTAAGEVILEVRFRGALMATYRALVLAVKNIPCRFNILNGPIAGTFPRATPADVQDHLAIANRYLYQIGLQLVLDTDVGVKDGAKATEIPGIFRIQVSQSVTWHIDSDEQSVVATGLNYRPNVMNFAYIHSERRPRIGGAATDWPNSTAPLAVGAAAGSRPTVSDSGTPSSSWIAHTGIPPDAAADPTTTKLITGLSRPGHPHLFAMFLCDNLGDPADTADQQRYAKAMCHELGHILNLGHRLEGVPETAKGRGDQRTMTANDVPAKLVAKGVFWDGLLYPPTENIMYWKGAGPTSQDFDIIQARAVRLSKLVPP